MATQPTDAVEVFYSYSHKDEELRDQLETHLAMLKREGVIKGWHDRRLIAGTEWGGQIDEHLKSADIILLLVSADFLASDYCYDIEVKQAMARHEAKEARVVPIILRPCDWTTAPFGKVQGLPKDAKPITLWPNRDEAFLDVAKGIRVTAKELLASRTTRPPKSDEPPPSLLIIPRAPVVGFIARRDEQGHDILARLQAELAPGRAQLVVLWGPGGTGKTTLAAETVRAVRQKFPQRIAWVSALGRPDFKLATLLDEIAAQFDRADLRPLVLEQKEAQVRAVLADAPALVVLDNFETVAPEEQVRCLNFLAGCAACSALVTTRGDTKRDDVCNVALAAMALDEAREYLRRLIEKTGRPQNFARLDADDLIVKCEANPLVLQWVVNQIKLARQPQTALDYLAQGEGDAAERVFDRSFNLPQVGDDGRAVLLALTLFVPSATRAALAEVAGFAADLPRLERAVENLSALWLVETTAGNERLILRGLTRELAKARLKQDAHADEYQRCFVAHFLRYAEAHHQPTPEDFDALEAEQDNLLAAMDAAERLSDWQSVIRLAEVLANPVSGVLGVRGYWAEALRCGEQAVEAARETQDEWAVAQFSANAAESRRQRGEYDAARQTYEQALAAFRTLGSDVNIAVCLHQLAVLAQAQGEIEAARHLYEESLAIKKKLGNQHGIANTLHQLAMLAQDQGELGEARRLYEESLEIRKKLGDQRGIASSLHQLAMLAQAQGEIEAARHLYEESLAIEKKLGNQSGIASTLGQLGLLAEKEGDRVEAARLLREALSIFERLKSPYAEMARRILARVEGE